MATASAPDMTDVLLRAWETLHAATPGERALGLLDAVWPQPDHTHWRQVSIGDRDASLFMLQASLFGEELQTIAACPACEERLESRFVVSDVCRSPAQLARPREPLELTHAGYRVRYRLPCSEDLLAVASEGDGEAAANAVLQRCVIGAERKGRAIAAGELPRELRRRLDDAMAAHDPVADLQMAVACPACGHRWSAALDIAAYLWEALDDWAQDLLAEVHVLARQYAWSERDILAMTPVRRRYYLDLLQA